MPKTSRGQITSAASRQWIRTTVRLFPSAGNCSLLTAVGEANRWHFPQQNTRFPNMEFSAQEQGSAVFTQNLFHYDSTRGGTPTSACNWQLQRASVLSCGVVFTAWIFSLKLPSYLAII